MKSKVHYLFSLIRSKKTSRKIVVFESDDWGSERIPNNDTKIALEKQGVDMNTNPHSRYDTLERVDDFLAYEDIVNDIYNTHGKCFKLTANFITGNPDYEMIKKSNYNNYYFEKFTETYLKRDGNNKVISKINDLVNSGFIRPQFHGREHVNATYWINELQRGNKKYRTAFDLGCYAIDTKNLLSHSKNLMAALEYQKPDQEKFIRNSLKVGHEIFKEVFGYNSTTFVPPRYVWNSSLESSLVDLGVTHIQTSLVQKVPTQSGYQLRKHFTGQKSNAADIRYLVRNSYFEPAYSDIDWVKSCLRKIDLAFCFKTPAIISTHRINFVGGLDNKARDANLIKLKKLVETIIIKYPEVEFLSSDELATII